MQVNHSTLVRRGAALVVTAFVAASAAACVSAKKPATPDTQAAQPSVAGQRDGDRGGFGRGGPGRGESRLFEGIALSDAQRAQVDSIRASYRDRMRAARENGGGDREQFRQTMDEQRKAIRAVLTPEQQNTFDANVEKMRSERGRRGPGGPGGPGN